MADAVSRDVLNKETNARFWAQTHYKVGQALDPNNPTDKAKIPVWLDMFRKVKAEADAGQLVTTFDHPVVAQSLQDAAVANNAAALHLDAAAKSTHPQDTQEHTRAAVTANQVAQMKTDEAAQHQPPTVSPKLEQDAAKEAAKSPPPAHAHAHQHLAHAHAQSPKTAPISTLTPTLTLTAPASTSREVLYKEANTRFWNRTHYKPGQKLDLSIAEDRRQAQVWMDIFHEIEREANTGHLQLTTEVPLSSPPLPLPPPPPQVPQPQAPISLPQIPQPGFPKPGFPQPGFQQPGFPQPGFPQPGFPQPGFPQPGFPQPGFPQPGFPQPGFPQPGFPQPVFPQPGFPQPGFPQPGFPQPGLPQPGLPQPGLPQPGLPQPGLPQPGFPTYPRPPMQPPMQPGMYPGTTQMPPMQRPPGRQMQPGMHARLYPRLHRPQQPHENGRHGQHGHGKHGHGKHGMPSTQPGGQPGMQPGGQPGMPPGGPDMGLPEGPRPGSGPGPDTSPSGAPPGGPTDMQPSGFPSIMTDAAPPEGMSMKAKIALGIVGLAVVGGFGYVWYKKSQSPGSAGSAGRSFSSPSAAPSARGRSPHGIAGRPVAAHSSLAFPAVRSGKV